MVIDRFEGSQNIILPAPLVTNYVRVEILEVYEGTRYEDTCITELRVY